MSTPRVLAFIDWYKPYFKAGGPVRRMVNLGLEHLGTRVQFHIVTGDRDYTATTNEAQVPTDQWTSSDVGEQVYHASPAQRTRQVWQRLIHQERWDVVYINGLFSVVTSADDVRLLWEMCSIPDYRKLLFESHAAFVLDLFVEVRDRGPVSRASLASRFAGVDDTTGDVDTLLARIAHVRLLSYVAQKESFVAEPAEIAGQAAEWVDRLSDALHAALVARFVTTGKRRVVPMTRAPSRGGRERVPEPPPSHTGPFAALAELRVGPARQAPTIERSIVHAIDEASFDDFELGPMGEVTLHGEEVLRLVRGRTLAEPAFKLTLARDLYSKSIYTPGSSGNDIIQLGHGWVNSVIGGRI